MPRRSKPSGKHKTDRNDAQLLLQLLLENRFPRIWVPNPENRDLRQLLWHRHRLVQMRRRIMNQLQALAMNGRAALETPLVECGRASPTGEVSVGSLG
jgi:transposase